MTRLSCKRRLSGVLLLLGVALGGLVSPNTTHGQEDNRFFPSPVIWELSTGIDYSVGDYGLDRDTKLLYFPFSLQATADRFRARLTLPLLSLDGPTGFLPSTGGVGLGDGLDVESEFGLGQLLLSGSYLFGRKESALPYLEATVRVGAPTETKRELGSRLWSGSLQLDVFDTYERVTPFMRVGRRFYEGSELDDRFYASIGANVKVFEAAFVGLAYDWLEATSSAVKDSHQLSPFLSFRWAERFRVGPYAVIGLSEGAPDYGLGCTIGVRL